MRRTYAGAGILLLSLLWAGIVIGVSFIATIAKFGAPSLTLPVALDVGRHTFAPLARIEWGLWAVLAMAVWASGAGRLRLAVTAFLAGLLLLQALWLLPVLDARVSLILAGTVPPPSRLHLLFIAGEAAKIGMLAVLAWGEIGRLVRASTRKDAGSLPSTPSAPLRSVQAGGGADSLQEP